MIRSLLAVPLVVLYTLAFSLPTPVLGLVDPSGQLIHALTRAWSRLILWTCGIEVTVRGAANAVSGPAVYAANHASMLDIPVVFGHLPVSFRIIHKRSLYLIPGIGWSLWFGGHIGIDRQNPFGARRSLAAAAARIRGGTSVVVFPEGTRSPDESIQPFKRGTFVLAVNARVPVVPVSLVGVKRVVPPGGRRLRPGRVEIRIHPAIATTNRVSGKVGDLAEEVRQAVIAGCASTPEPDAAGALPAPHPG